MSELIQMIYEGAGAAVEQARCAAQTAERKYGQDREISFGGTAYSLPLTYAAFGDKVQKTGDLSRVLQKIEGMLVPQNTLGGALQAGLAAAISAELVEAARYLEPEQAYELAPHAGIGFVPDAILRSLGVPLVTGDVPAMAVVIGRAKNAEEAARTVRAYQDNGILTFLIGGVIDQCEQAGIRTGLERRVIPLGHDLSAAVHAMNAAARIALIFGSIRPGDLTALLDYTKKRVPAFVNVFGTLDALTTALGAGAVAFGFPLLADSLPEPFQIPGALERCADAEKLIGRSMELREVRVRRKTLSLPVGFSATYEGEIIRRNDMAAEFLSGRGAVCELVQMHSAEGLEREKTEVIGPELDEGAENLVLSVLVAGKKMQTDFEPVIERRLHVWLNWMEGVMHTGQRNQLRIRISRTAFSAGLRLRHLAQVICGKILEEFSEIVERCQVSVITDRRKAEEFLKTQALIRYEMRDVRTLSLSDESADRFYTCVLCQSFAPAHCCVITPERPGLCGAVSWLDAKAACELNRSGPSQSVLKKDCLDERSGHFRSVDEAVQRATHGAIEAVSLYSILESPMSSCGCFECISAIEPASGGIMTVSREYSGMTPLGMTFGELAACTGGGVQTPGYMGHGRSYLLSAKFARAEEGLLRLVWMPKELKSELAERLNRVVREQYGVDGFAEKIADESVTTDCGELYAFLREKEHPVLRMKALLA